MESQRSSRSSSRSSGRKSSKSRGRSSSSKRHSKRSGAFRKAYKAYKSVRYDETLDYSQRLVIELNMRVDFSKKYFDGKIDDGHMSYMRRVGNKLNIDQKMCLSLDAYRIIS